MHCEILLVYIYILQSIKFEQNQKPKKIGHIHPFLSLKGNHWMVLLSCQDKLVRCQKIAHEIET